MEEEKILDIVDIREHIAFILNKQFDTNIKADNIWLDPRPKQMKYSYSFYIRVKMIGIKHEDKNKILDYCIRECIKKHDALLGI